MPLAFLSYRRDDSAGFAGRLADALEAQFGTGSVFRDVDDIRPGEDFVQAIQSHLADVAVILVMIGPSWLDVDANGKRRLDHADDFVRREIELALASKKPIIPLLVGGAGMPAEAVLPDSVAGLARRQAVVLSDNNWRGDVERLITSLCSLLPKNTDPRPNWRRRMLGLAGAGLALAVLAWGIRVWLPTFVPKPEVTTPADINGRWTARVKYDWGDQHDEVFEFKYLGDALHGTATYLGGRLTIENVQLKGNWLSFITRSQEMLGSDTPWKEVTHHYTGQVSKDAIHFTLETSGGHTPHPPIEFVAQRVSP